jgi:predicted AlkP superfamily phosphohydrolase/phosphomutase
MTFLYVNFRDRESYVLIGKKKRAEFILMIYREFKKLQSNECVCF